jgi:hypothetical protein
MKETSRSLILLVAAFCPAILHGHALSPTHYPLGPMPSMLVSESWAFVSMIPVTLIATTIVLWAWIRPPGFGGHLWRALIFYTVSRAFETGMLFACPKIGWTAPGWTSSSLETLGSLAACLVAGLIPATLLGLPLYKGTLLPMWRRVLAVATATAGGYVAAFTCGLLVTMVAN